MTVEPGFGGQSFMPGAAAKCAVLRKKFPDLCIQVRHVCCAGRQVGHVPSCTTMRAAQGVSRRVNPCGDRTCTRRDCARFAFLMPVPVTLLIVSRNAFLGASSGYVGAAWCYSRCHRSSTRYPHSRTSWPPGGRRPGSFHHRPRRRRRRQRHRGRQRGVRRGGPGGGHQGTAGQRGSGGSQRQGAGVRAGSRARGRQPGEEAAASGKPPAEERVLQCGLPARHEEACGWRGSRGNQQLQGAGKRGGGVGARKAHHRLHHQMPGGKQGWRPAARRRRNGGREAGWCLRVAG